MLEKACFQVGAIDPSRDEYDFRPVVGVGPGRELPTANAATPPKLSEQGKWWPSKWGCR